MRFQLDQTTLTLFLEGEINSYNADGIEKEINATLQDKSFSALVLDLEHLAYISSAGLRVVLKLKQKYGEVSVINCSLEVYDIFSMTGFTNIMTIKKAMKRVYVSGAEIIGTGYFSTVYRIDKDTIIKVFNRVSDPAQIERELHLAKEAFILGIPTAISFDIVKVDDKLGVRFEMLDCMSLRDAVLAHPEELGKYVDKYVGLLHTIGTTECPNPEIPDIKKFTLKKLEDIKPHLHEKYYEKAKKMLEAVPDRRTFVHGDCHFKNIMVQNDELLLIDMDTLSVGHPIFEFAALYAPYCAFDEDDPGNSERFLKVKSEDVQRLWNVLTERCLGTKDQAVKDKIRIVAYIHMVWWNRLNEPENNVRLEGCRSRLYGLLDRYNDLVIPDEK